MEGAWRARGGRARERRVEGAWRARGGREEGAWRALARRVEGGRRGRVQAALREGEARYLSGGIKGDASVKF